jgi:hypothetical protein
MFPWNMETNTQSVIMRWLYVLPLELKAQKGPFHLGTHQTILGGNGFYQDLFYSATRAPQSGFTVTSGMAEPKAGFGSSEPINSSEEELACHSKESNSAI